RCVSRFVNSISDMSSSARSEWIGLSAFFEIASSRSALVFVLIVHSYVRHRREQGASAASCNLELAIVKRAYRLALRAKELIHAPYIPMLKLRNVRQGFLERDQFEAVRAALPEELRGIVTLAY